MDTCVLEFCPCTFGFERVAPQGQELSFVGWWRKAVGKVEKRRRKGFNSLIILGAWTLWIHRNKCVFYGVSPSQGYPALLRRGKEALVSSGSKKLQEFGVGQVPSHGCKTAELSSLQQIDLIIAGFNVAFISTHVQ